MSWGKNTSFPPLQIVVWIIQFCPQRWIYQESSGWSSAWESQFAGKSLDLIVEFLWKWGRPVTDPLKLETAGDTASNPWEKDRCMLKQSHIVHIYIRVYIYICVCVWHFCDMFVSPLKKIRHLPDLEADNWSFSRPCAVRHVRSHYPPGHGKSCGIPLKECWLLMMNGNSDVESE